MNLSLNHVGARAVPRPQRERRSKNERSFKMAAQSHEHGADFLFLLRCSRCGQGAARAPLQLLMALCLLLAHGNVQVSAALRAGAAIANITPPLGIEINGGTAPVIATHVHDELHARALVLDDGTTWLAFVVVDNCLIDRAPFDEAKALIFRHTGIRSNHVSISCTHTHSAGSVVGVHLSEPDPEYRRAR